MAEHHGGLLDDAAARVADFGFLHFEPQVVALAGAFAHAGEDRKATVCRGDAGDQLGENHGFSQTGPTEQAGFTAANERREQVDDLDAGFEQLGFGRELRDVGSLAVDGPGFFGLDRAALVDRFAQQVEDAAQGGFAHRHANGAARVDALLTADEAIGAAQCHAANAAAAEVLLHFAHELDFDALLLGFDTHGVEDGRQPIFRKHGIERGADHLRDVADVGFGRSLCCDHDRRSA